MPYSEEDCIAISGLQHLAFCERQWGLIHLDQEWAENKLTAEGKTLHERVDEGYKEFRKGLRQYSGLHVRSTELGLYGRLDVLEALESEGPTVDIPLLGLKGNWSLQPVEFKRGKPKSHDSDLVQLCAQALCLEEMTGLKVASGSIFYGQTRHRSDVVFTDLLIDRTRSLSIQAHSLLQSGKLPIPVYKSHCRACSLVDACFPKLSGSKEIDEYRKDLLG